MKKLLVITSLLLCASLSCERHENMNVLPVNKDQRSISIEEARQYYSSVINVRVSNQIQTANKTEREINWEYAKKVTQENGLEVIVTPVIYKTNKRPGILFWNDNTEAAKKLPTKENMLEARESYLTFKDKDGNIQSQIVQFLASKEYKQKNKEKISSKDFTGWIVAMTWDEKLITGFEFKNGKDVRQLLVPTSSETANARLSSCDYTYYQNVTANCNICGSNMTCCDVFISGGYQGTCTGPSSNSGTDNNYNIVYGGSSGGGGEYSYVPAEQRSYTNFDIITDPNLSECISGILWKMNRSYINSYITSEFRKLYGDNSGTRNFYFKPGSLDPNEVARYTPDNNTIVIDQSKVGQSSNEFVASVIAHELAHVIITEYQTTGIVPPDQYAQHMDIFQNMVLNISYILTNAYPDLSANNRQDAIALALGGIADVLFTKNGNVRPNMDQMAITKYGTTLNQAYAIIGTYQNGTKGTKCN